MLNREFALGPGGLPLAEKTVPAVIRLGYDLTKYLANVGPTIGISSYSVSATDLVVAEHKRTGGLIEVTVSGGTLGQIGRVTVTFTMDNAGVPLVDTSTILVAVI